MNDSSLSSVEARAERADARERGHALVLSLMLSVMAVSLVGLLSTLSSQNVRRASASRDDHQLEAAARVGVAHAKLIVWDAWVQSSGGTPGSLDDFRTYLDDAGLSAGETAYLDVLGQGLLESPPAVGALQALNLGDEGSAVRMSLEVAISRDDRADATFVSLVSTARDGGQTQRATETVFRVGRPEWSGFRYAVVGEDLSYLLDQGEVSSVERFFGQGDPATHERIKLAALDEIRLRAGTSWIIAGTLYTRGHVLDGAGNALGPPPPSVVAALGINADGTLDGTSLFALTDGTPGKSPLANYYTDYPSAEADMFDGVMPTSIPPLVPTDADGKVNDTEWLAAASEMTGQIADGVVKALPKGTPYSTPLLPTSGLSSLGSGFTGNTILIGTPLVPLVIDGTVAVDGDVVVSGVIKGKGSIVARGNIYVVGDLQYADGVDGAGERTFGRAADGTTNSLALVAHGNLVHGAFNLDYKKPLLPSPLPALPSFVDDNSPTNETAEMLAGWNRQEWAKTQPFYDASTGRLTTTDTGQPNSAWGGASYVPRYYSFSQGGTPRMFMASDTAWDNGRGVWTGTERGTPNASVLDADPWAGSSGGPLVPLPQAGVDYQGLPLAPDWILPTVYGVLNMVNDVARAGLGKSGPYQVDALLYSSNAVLLNADPKSGGRGSVVVNGGVIARQVGVHATGGNHDLDGDGVKSKTGLVVNYDARLRSLLDVDDTGSGMSAIYTLYDRER